VSDVGGSTSPATGTGTGTGSVIAPHLPHPRFTRRWLGWALVTLALAVVIVTVVPRLDLPFGHSNDGFNGAVWGADSRALREDGVIDSRLGGVRADGTRYANHPPLIVVATAGAETVLGEHRWVTRGVPLAATLAALVLLYLLCLSLGYRSAISGLAVLVVAVTPMALGFGTMLDTPVTSLPFGIAVLLAWQHRRLGRSLPHWAEATLAALACLSGWQATILVGGVIAASVVASLRSQRHVSAALRGVLPMLVGAAVGSALSFAWPAWVYSGLSPMFDQFRHRTGRDGSGSVLEAARFQAVQVRTLLGVASVGLLGTLAALWRPTARAVSAAGLLIVAVHIVVFHQGALHFYWAYWVVLPATIGIAELATLVASSDLVRRSPVVGSGLLAIVVLALVVDARLPSPADQTRAGAVPAELLRGASWPSDQASAVIIGTIVDPDAWVEYETRRAVAVVDEAEDLRARASARPDDVALLVGSCAVGQTGDLCRSLWSTLPPEGSGDREYRVTTLGQLSSALNPSP
jgi:hypothetical protein